MSGPELDRTVVHLNLGVCDIATMKHVLQREPESRLYQSLEQNAKRRAEIEKDIGATLFPCFGDTIYLSRNASLIRILISALRHPQMRCILPDNFTEWTALLSEAYYLGLKTIAQWIQDNKPIPSTIIVAYHGTLAFGKQGISSDINFRKISRILISGRAAVCRQVFGESLNEGRDSCDMGDEARYAYRLFLKHTSLEQAFDALAAKGFRLISAAAYAPSAQWDVASTNNDERYMHYTQFIFERR